MAGQAVWLQRAGGKRTGMGRVKGIGGVFFKAQNPERMTAWYQEHLGIRIKDGCADFAWREKDQHEQIGRRVWAIFASDSSQFGDSRSPLMINYRVANLEKVIEPL